MYSSLFFFGLEPGQGGKYSDVERPTFHRPSKSPFFTPAEQLGQQYVREDMLQDVYSSSYPSSNSKWVDNNYVQSYMQEIQDVEEYITDLKEELGVLEVTMLAAESSNDKKLLDSQLYNYKIKQRESIRYKIKLAEKELEDLQRSAQMKF